MLGLTPFSFVDYFPGKKKSKNHAIPTSPYPFFAGILCVEQVLVVPGIEGPCKVEVVGAHQSWNQQLWLKSILSVIWGLDYPWDFQDHLKHMGISWASIFVPIFESLKIWE